MGNKRITLEVMDNEITVLTAREGIDKFEIEIEDLRDYRAQFAACAEHETTALAAALHQFDELYKYIDERI